MALPDMYCVCALVLEEDRPYKLVVYDPLATRSARRRLPDSDSDPTLPRTQCGQAAQMPAAKGSLEGDDRSIGFSWRWVDQSPPVAQLSEDNVTNLPEMRSGTMMNSQMFVPGRPEWGRGLWCSVEGAAELRLPVCVCVDP